MKLFNPSSGKSYSAYSQAVACSVASLRFPLSGFKIFYFVIAKIKSTFGYTSMKTLPLLVALIGFPLLLKADEKTMKILDKAYIHALDKQYKQAIDKALPLLDSLALNKTEEIVLAHQILTLSFCETGNKEKTAEHLKALKAFSPNEDFRAFSPSPECQKLLGSSDKITAKKKKH